jgi:hypothetical protein
MGRSTHRKKHKKKLANWKMKQHHNQIRYQKKFEEAYNNELLKMIQEQKEKGNESGGINM